MVDLRDIKHERYQIVTGEERVILREGQEENYSALVRIEDAVGKSRFFYLFADGIWRGITQRLDDLVERAREELDRGAYVMVVKPGDSGSIDVPEGSCARQ